MTAAPGALKLHHSSRSGRRLRCSLLQCDSKTPVLSAKFPQRVPTLGCDALASGELLASGRVSAALTGENTFPVSKLALEAVGQVVQLVRLAWSRHRAALQFGKSCREGKPLLLSLCQLVTKGTKAAEHILELPYRSIPQCEFRFVVAFVTRGPDSVEQISKFGVIRPGREPRGERLT